jgi:hypothetical protein
VSNIVEGTKVIVKELKDMTLDALSHIYELAEENGRYPRVYLHWSAGHYHQFYDGYHISIDDDGSIFVVTNDLSEILSHTWRRNSGAIGVSLACGAFCTSSDLGNEPPTEAQIESIAQVTAVLCKYLDIPIDFDHVMTHGEVGDRGDDFSPTYEPYGQNTTCERWDLAILHNGDEWGSGGEILRGKANWYLENGNLP